MKKRIIVGIALLLISGAISLFVINRTFTVAYPRLGAVTTAVYATGVVESTAEVPLSFEIPGLLKNLWVDEGQSVTTGQPLAELEHDELDASIEQLKVDIALTKSELKRKEDLWKKSAGSLEQYENAKAAYERALYTYQTSLAKKADYKLLAPTDGSIVKREAEVGQTLKADEVFLWFSPNTLRITAEVDEENMPKVQVGQKVHLRAPAFPTELFEGIVQAITPKGDAVQRTYRVRFRMIPPHPEVKMGMTIEANIVVRELDKAVLIPSSAIIQGAVWCIVKGKLVKKKVKVGTQGLEEAEILEGITLKEAVIKEPSSSFKEGQWAMSHTIRP